MSTTADTLENAFWEADAAYKAAIQKWHNAKGTHAELDAPYLAATGLRAKAGAADEAWQAAKASVTSISSK